MKPDLKLIRTIPVKPEPQFEGGPIALHSGGTGPDDYVFRKVGARKWTKVVCRWGRNFPKFTKYATGKIPADDPDLVKAVTEAAWDRLAFNWVLRHKIGHLPVSDAAKKAELKSTATMSIYDFAVANGFEVKVP